MNRRDCLASGLALLAAAKPAWASEPLPDDEASDEPPSKEPFSLFVATPERAVIRMLELARVTSNDLVLDLGSGDGRIPIVAARRYGARGRGVDINPRLVEQSVAEARRQDVAGRVRFETGDVMDTDVSAATVVTMYLFPALIARLKPKLWSQLKPGARIVVYDYSMTEWPAEEALTLYVPERYLGRGGDVTARLWVRPADFSGRWFGMMEAGSGLPLELSIDQRYQRIQGTGRMGGANVDLYNAHVQGPTIEFLVEDAARTRYEIVARLEGNSMRGEARIQGGTENSTAAWMARRVASGLPIDRPV
ncbi:MAG: hypothetical protein A3I01_13535 [Betaproteobacteria bacterium RIFCSPLOWO2_02_FULL_65_24]|nr:MAG: hypothetical protein A3I01_13535 [Betaproteobacteria bacterium RIFCSPLOWO2_02_FULL_65_24]